MLTQCSLITTGKDLGDFAIDQHGSKESPLVTFSASVNYLVQANNYHKEFSSWWLVFAVENM